MKVIPSYCIAHKKSDTCTLFCSSSVGLMLCAFVRTLFCVLFFCLMWPVCTTVCVCVRVCYIGTGWVFPFCSELCVCVSDWRAECVTFAQFWHCFLSFHKLLKTAAEMLPSEWTEYFRFLASHRGVVCLLLHKKAILWKPVNAFLWMCFCPLFKASSPCEAVSLD